MLALILPLILVLRQILSMSCTLCTSPLTVKLSELVIEMYY